ncbi:hypothetical protein N7495_007900 [Penicillium taxi]|uniref:uncharacterized protein n=1 Tax=Penicillium taxi TaxID=168475 RepID=UPI002544EBB1|nr:uncharacterized protein N7495_007900 [Penicillium taxi]KAJ5887859.1 hypothetical protein N7495_007900 [Penicillium taxi]
MKAVNPDIEPDVLPCLVFGMSVSQRLAVSYVHYPHGDIHCMTFLDSYYFTKPDDRQKCHDFVVNVTNWMERTQLPHIKGLLSKLAATMPANEGSKENSRSDNKRPASSPLISPIRNPSDFR